MDEFFSKVNGVVDWLYEILAKLVTLIEGLVALGSKEESAE